jgi:hypothetical protein
MVPASCKHKSHQLPLSSPRSHDATHLGGETLGVVEVGGDGDDGLLDGLSELGLGGLTELGEDHGGDLGGGEELGLSEVLDLDAQHA